MVTELNGTTRVALEAAPDAVLQSRHLNVWYGSNLAVAGIDLDIYRHRITAIIGPSGSGKSTLLHAFNRMNDLIPGTRVDGTVLFEEVDMYVVRRYGTEEGNF